jgi:anti-anti-sigma factor
VPYKNRHFSIDGGDVSIINVPAFPVGKQPGLRGDQIAGFSTHWVRPSVAVVTASGELDASNARQFTDYAVGHISRSKELILDLTAVEFFSVSSFPTLHNVNLRCAREGVNWMLTPSVAVARVLRVCDPQRQLPTSPTVAMAWSQLRDRRGGGRANAEAAADATFAV